VSERPPIAAPTLVFRQVSMERPFHWIEAGVNDMLHTPSASLGHGVAMILGAIFIMAVGWRALPLMAGAFSGFLIVAPMLACGLYDISRRIERGEPVSLLKAIGVWRRIGRAPLVLGAALAAVGTLWVLVSILTLAGMTTGPVLGLQSFLTPEVWRASASAAKLHLFVMWLVAGGLLASLVFAATALSIPMLIDRRLGARDAVLASIEAVSRNPLPMLLWTLLILAGTAFGIATLFGLVVVWPVLGHAAWHAYRDLIDAEAVEPRD
jgi:uncharacterized membrane protein